MDFDKLKEKAEDMGLDEDRIKEGASQVAEVISDKISDGSIDELKDKAVDGLKEKFFDKSED